MVPRVRNQKGPRVEEEKPLRVGELHGSEAAVLRAPRSRPGDGKNVGPVTVSSRVGGHHPVVARVGDGEQAVRACCDLAGEA